MKRDLEQQLKRMRRVPAPESLDQRMEVLFEEAGEDAAGDDLELRLLGMRRVAAPESLDHRMDALFEEADRSAVRRPWMLPAWAAAAAGLILVVSLLIRGGLGPKPVVVEIMPTGQLEQFLLGGEPSSSPADLGIFTRGGCSVETVWPADAPGWDRRSVNGRTANGDPQ